jgi:dihydroorotase
MELYAAAFEMADKLDKLEGFASFFGPDFYRLPRNTKKVVLRRIPWQIPDSLPFPGDAIVPLAAGEQLNWRLQA